MDFMLVIPQQEGEGRGEGEEGHKNLICLRSNYLIQTPGSSTKGEAYPFPPLA